MTIVYEKLLNVAIPTGKQTYARMEIMLYALGFGGGRSRRHEKALFIYEKNLRALPMLAVVLTCPGLQDRDLDTSIDYLKVVQGEQV